MLVSDPTKLADTAQNIDSGPWTVPKNPSTAVLARLKLAATRRDPRPGNLTGGRVNPFG